MNIFLELLLNLPSSVLFLLSQGEGGGGGSLLGLDSEHQGMNVEYHSGGIHSKCKARGK